MVLWIPAGLPCASPTGLSPSLAPPFQAASAAHVFLCAGPNPGLPEGWPVWALPRSLATTSGITVVFSSWSYLDVSVRSVSPRRTIYSCVGARVFAPGGFPHSEICGSMDICSFPQLIAACRVLLRLLMPRHSPCALHSLTLLFEAEFFTDKI